MHEHLAHAIKHGYVARDHVSALRRQLGFSQAEAAKLVHQTSKTWSNWELGKRKMHVAFLELFLRKTGLY